jgi:hypothetical protein
MPVFAWVGDRLKPMCSCSPLHRLDKHASEQSELADSLAERMQMPGGVASHWHLGRISPPRRIFMCGLSGAVLNAQPRLDAVLSR